MKRPPLVHGTLLTLAAAGMLALAGCASPENDDDMVPLAGTGETPTVANRFPDSPTRLAPTESERDESKMTPLQRMFQY